MIDKSKDYLYQNSTIRIWYLSKTVEGSTTFNTNSAAAFKAASGVRIVDYVVRNMPEGSGLLENDGTVFHLWREQTGDLLPAQGDKIYDGQWFWLVSEVQLADRDDLLPYNRFRLTCIRSKMRAVA